LTLDAGDAIIVKTSSYWVTHMKPPSALSPVIFYAVPLHTLAKLKQFCKLAK